MTKKNIESIGELDQETVIWKYVDIWKYLDLLKNKSLHFSRLDKFISDDPAEGLATYQYIKYYFPSLTREKTKEQKKEWVSEELTRKINARRFYAVSCWHMNNNEDMAMWKIYANKDYGVAIRTTIGKLVNELEDSQEMSIKIGKIIYQDRMTIKLSNNDFHPHHFFIKNPHYKFEKELRVLIDRQPSKPSDSSDDWSSINQPDSIDDSGVSINIKLKDSIDEVRLSPYLSGYQADIINDITSKYGLKTNIVKKSEYDVASYQKEYIGGIKSMLDEK